MDITGTSGVERAISALQSSLHPDTIEVGDEALLDFTEETGWSYYMIRHKTRSIFWAHPCDCSSLAKEIGTVKSRLHRSKATHLT